MAIPTFTAVVVFVLVHVFVGRLRFLDGVPRSRWLSMVGGVAVAYVFLHVLPELGAHQRTFETWATDAEVGFLEFEIYPLCSGGTLLGSGLLGDQARSRRASGGAPQGQA
ncbi:hypothetical protein [Skermanella pratensis]|uniref:hypothetical protein n=1 Tax=Skermanella pratensis TaxID=2233999 RepID=UPI001B3B57B9|nr:hypothetical protein [Skermanella pratensis]